MDTEDGVISSSDFRMLRLYQYSLCHPSSDTGGRLEEVWGKSSMSSRS